MNLCAFKNGKICFSSNLYYSSRPPEFFSEHHWMTPQGLLIPMGSPAIQMREFLFDPSFHHDPTAVNCYTAGLVDGEGRFCTLEFQKNTEDGTFRDYRVVDKDNAWIITDDYTLMQTAAMLIDLVEEPRDILPLIARLQPFVTEGFVQYNFVDLTRIVKETMGKFEVKEPK